jgi:RimJ/RimL family protein N-acetyltransferase
MELIPIHQTAAENAGFYNHPECVEILDMTITYFEKTGYQPPWIGYFAQKNGQLVGSAAFKGAPKNNRIEIAYGVLEPFRQRGFGTEICRALVGLATSADPSVVITARTLPEKNFSTRILEKNGFHLLGVVQDEEDGAVWEWEFKD